MDADGSEFDAWDPANMAPVVAWLAERAAADVSGQVFVVYGGQVHLMARAGQHRQQIDKGERWTATELADEKNGCSASTVAGAPKNPGRGVSMLLVDQLRFMAGTCRTRSRYRNIDGRAHHVRGVGRPSRTGSPAASSHAGVAKGDRVAVYLAEPTCCAGSSPTRRCTRRGPWPCPRTRAWSARELVAILGHAEVAAMHHRARPLRATGRACSTGAS